MYPETTGPSWRSGLKSSSLSSSLSSSPSPSFSSSLRSTRSEPSKLSSKSSGGFTRWIVAVLPQGRSLSEPGAEMASRQYGRYFEPSMLLSRTAISMPLGRKTQVWPRPNGSHGAIPTSPPIVRAYVS